MRPSVATKATRRGVSKEGFGSGKNLWIANQKGGGRSDLFWLANYLLAFLLLMLHSPLRGFEMSNEFKFQVEHLFWHETRSSFFFSTTSCFHSRDREGNGNGNDFAPLTHFDGIISNGNQCLSWGDFNHLTIHCGKEKRTRMEFFAVLGDSWVKLAHSSR